MIVECPKPRAVDTFDPGDWWSATDGELLDCVREHGTVTMSDLCQELGLSEGAATAFLSMLAREGRVRITRIEIAD